MQESKLKSLPGSTNLFRVSHLQRGNPVLKHLRNVAWEFDDVIPDYHVNTTTSVIFLSLKYHNLHPNYIHNRLKSLGTLYDLRVLLVLVDTLSPEQALKELAIICFMAELTMIVAFSDEEAARYLECLKTYENKTVDTISSSDREFNLLDAFTQFITASGSTVHKTDAVSLLTKFKTVTGVLNASVEDISSCAGFGAVKAQQVFDTLHTSFKPKSSPETTILPTVLTTASSASCFSTDIPFASVLSATENAHKEPDQERYDISDYDSD